MKEQVLSWAKFSQMSILQQRVVEFGVCPNCHTKTLARIYTSEICTSSQCRTCFDVWILDPGAKP